MSSVGDAIGELLPAAVAVALFPIPIITVVLLLGSERGRRTGPAFLVGWVAGVAGAGVILLLLADGAEASGDGEPAGWVPWLNLALGVALVLLALRQWRGRPRGDVELPSWMQAVDAFTVPRAAAAGVALSGLNPKNIVLIAAAAATIAEMGISAGEQVLALAVFVALASLGVASPVVLSLLLGERARAPLGRVQALLAANSAAIVSVLLLLIGAKLVGDAISGLS